MDPQGDESESAEVDFATRRLRELDEFLCQPSQSNASVDSSEVIPFLNILGQLEEISTDSSTQHIGPTANEDRLITPPPVSEVVPAESLDSQSINHQEYEDQQNSEQQQIDKRHQLPLTFREETQTEQEKESHTVSTSIKLEHKYNYSPTPSTATHSHLNQVVDYNNEEKESSRSPLPEISCNICGCPRYCKKTERGTLCQNCYKLCYLTRPTEPCRRRGNCSLVWRPRKSLCVSCRMRRAISLGFVEPNTIDIDDDDELDEDIQMQLAIHASLEQEEEQWQDYSSLIKDNTKDEEAKTPRMIESKSDDIEHPAGGVYIEVTQEEPLPPIDQGLPENVSTCFSRWWWNDLQGFKKGGIAPKRPEDEVLPRKLVRVMRTSNDISDPQLDFVTQDIDIEEPEPLEEIFTPIMQILANASLTRGHEAAQSMRAGDAVVAQAKPKLTLRLETHRTIIDRRPMLKKLKAGTAPRNNNETNGVSSTSLIAPGEDCDDSDDDQVLEID